MTSRATWPAVSRWLMLPVLLGAAAFSGAQTTRPTPMPPTSVQRPTPTPPRGVVRPPITPRIPTPPRPGARPPIGYRPPLTPPPPGDVEPPPPSTIPVRTPPLTPPRTPPQVSRTPAPKTGPAKFTLPKSPFLLKLSPASQAARIGDTVTHEVTVESFEKQPFDELQFRIKFDPRLIKVRSVNAVGRDGSVPRTAEVGYDNAEGTIDFSAKYKEPLARHDRPLTIGWRPVADAGTVGISFERKVEKTALHLDGKLLAGSGGASWLLSSIVRLTGEEGLTKPKVIFERTGGSSAAELADCRVLLGGDKTPPRPGQIWRVDVMLDNSAGREIADIELNLRFDPRKLAVIDFDKNNFIRRGINLWDGFAHETHPFDRHFDNHADPRGNIYYRMGFQKPQNCPSGVFARVFLAVLQDATPQDLTVERVTVR